MEQLTDKFVSALSRSHRVAQKVELLVEGDKIDLTNEGIVANGTVQISSTETRRTVDISFVDENGLWLPFDVNDPLAPAGNELQLYRGIDYQDGTDSELIPIGLFRFVQVDVPAPKIQLQGYDRSWVIKGNPFSETVTIASGTNVVVAIQEILNRTLGSAAGAIETNFPDLDEVTNTMTFESESDPWTAMQNLASNVGHDLFFNPRGVLTMVPVPDPDILLPVWEFDENSVTNIGLPGIKMSWDASNAVNQVIVIGENPDNNQVYRGVAQDTDPNSPTQYGGPFGRRTMIIRDEKIASQAQADSRARAEMIRRLGIPRSITIPSLVNPAFDAGDVIWVTSNKLGGLTQVAIIDQFSVPLRASETMTLDTRQRLVAA